LLVGFTISSLSMIASVVDADVPRPGGASPVELTRALADVDSMAWIRADVSGKRLVGQFVQLEPSALRLRVDVFDDQEVVFDDVSALSIRVGNQTDKGLRWGALIGGCSGFVVYSFGGGWYLDQDGPNIWSAIAFSCLGITAGGVIGGFIGSTIEVWHPIWP